MQKTLRLNQLIEIYQWLKKGDINIVLFLLKSAIYNAQGRKIFSHHNTTIRGVKNIQVNDGRLVIGKEDIGFLDGRDWTLLNIRGKLIVNGVVSIGKGCRIVVADNAVCTLTNCIINGETRLIIMHGLEIGEGSRVAWGCEFLDEDFHQSTVKDAQQTPNSIKVGEHVWITSHARLLKGAAIGNGSIVASGAIVTKDFSDQENVLIAGVPAKVLKTNIAWEG